MTTPTNLTEICQRFGKHAFHFADNIDPETERPFKESLVTKKGRGACTTVNNDRVLCEFLLWLSPETRQMLPVAGLEKTLEFAKRYKK